MKKNVFLLLLITLVALWLRIPSISEGLPFFYNEDEGHHFNRTVDMVKSGDLNPHYFHKPSLHFYLRIPIVALSYLQGVKKGVIHSVKEIRTHDIYGLGGYSFTASHPGIVKGNRAFTVFLSLLMVVFTYLITKELTGSEPAGLLAALVTAVSSELVRYGAVIGVDILMSLVCLISVYLALLAARSFSIGKLIGVGVVAGLAVSSKYNALPIAILPLLVCFMAEEFTFQSIIVALLSPCLGFLIGSPYVITSIPLFLDQLGYEVWHYKVAGHEGHTGEPGISQAIFYLRWFAAGGVGVVCLLTAAFGVIPLRRSIKQAVVFLSFPFLYFIMMCMMKANFERNMLVEIPFLAALCGAFTVWISRGKRIPIAILGCVILFQPLKSSLELRDEQRTFVDSRLTLVDWLKGKSAPQGEKAIEGEIQFPYETCQECMISSFGEKTENPLSLYMKGYSSMITLHDSVKDLPGKELLKSLLIFPGEPDHQRIVNNPEIQVYGFDDSKLEGSTALSYVVQSKEAKLFLSPHEDTFSCNQEVGSENYCWTKRRYNRVLIPEMAQNRNFSGNNGKVNVKISMMSPWPNQKVDITFEDMLIYVPVSFDSTHTGTWQEINVTLPYQELKDEGGFILRNTEVHAPDKMGIGEDSRRIGVAIKSLTLPSH